MSEKVVVPMVQHSLRGRDLTWAVALAAPFLATHLLTPLKLHWFLLSVVCAAPLLVALLMLLQWQAPGVLYLALLVLN